MNINRKVKKAGTIGAVAVTALSLGIGSLAYYSNNNVAEAKKAAVKTEASKDTEKNTAKSGDLFKEESVYVNADATGKTSKITVADWLKNAGSTATLKDISGLSDITNVKGEEKFTQDSDSLTWNTDGEDIYYQGTTDKALPVGVNITYELDGTEVQPKDIIGKSGKLTMHITYMNTSKEKAKVDGKETEIYTPFTMITGMVLPTENFSNITIDHGKVLSDGSNSIVVGVGLPGLKESLDLKDKDKLDIPEEITVTADVTKFKMKSTVTVASADILSELNLDDVDDLDDLQDSLDDLQDASTKLVDGSGDLADGVKKLYDKTGTFKDGVNTLDNGINKLADGANKLKSGTKTYVNGTGTLADGIKKYITGVNTFSKSILSYIDGTGTLATGINTLATSIKDMPTKVGALSTGINQVAEGFNKLASDENINALKTGASSVDTAVSQLNTGLTSVKGGVSTINTSLAQLETSYENNEKALAALKTAINGVGNLDPNTPAKETMQKAIAGLEETTKQQKAAIAQLKAATASDSTLGKGVDALVNNTAENSTLRSGTKKLSSAINTIADGCKTLKEAFPALQTGGNQLATASSALVTNVDKMNAGAKKLVANNKKIKSATKQLSFNGKTIKSGAKKIKNNGSTLLAGVDTVQSGTSQLKTAGTKLVDGASQLNSGVNTLLTGANKLSTNLNKFDNDGIDKLVNTVDDDVMGVLDRFKAVRDSSKNYKTFSGKSDDMDGSVKFILETDEVK